jgi:hypothetical protein
MSGFQWYYEEGGALGRLINVWSAPNYGYKSGNKACVMKVREKLPVEFVRFEKDPKSHIKPEVGPIGYFA